jgi:deazaflavin-dependent oxidoreductase (nitroreductase family)
MTATRSATQPEPPHPTRPIGALPRGYARLVQRLGHGRWFAVALRQLGGARLDAALYRRTGGRLSIAGPALFPVLLLTTIGRRTGRPRTTPLIYVRDRERLVVSSESFGQTRAAAWPLNLAADPRVTVQLGAACSTFHARPATDEEAARLWPRLVAAWPAHETYRRRSGMRQVFVLEPADPAA